MLAGSRGRFDCSKEGTLWALMLSCDLVMMEYHRCGCVPVVSIAQNGSTSLMLAADRGNIEVARCLLWRGADVNAVDKVG